MSKRPKGSSLEQTSLEGVDLDQQLADLPLQRAAGSAEPHDPAPAARRSRPGEAARDEAAHGKNLDLFDEAPAAASGGLVAAPAGVSAGAHEEAREEARWVGSSPPERVLGGLADLTVHVGVLAAALLAMSTLALVPSLDHWPGFLVFLLCFSFLYHVVPLAFWGQTPGMAWRGLRARDVGGDSLSFGQSGVRWACALVTVVLCGLPILLAFGGNASLSDRISHSRTLRRVD
ncbi:MAG TPA: RDD family protein [Thermoanaerobaculia bacterium]|nr:RDD family protein [Thermoanaerobaculia bacterium]